MNNKIEETESNAAYDLARKVRHDGMLEKDAKRALVENFGMNPGSASDLIRNFTQMMDGKPYHRTLNHITTRIYFERILSDYGESILEIAVTATIAHADYYETLENGGKQPGLRAICSEFQSKIISAHAVFAETISADFQKSIEDARKDDPELRHARLAKASREPSKRLSYHIIHIRNPDVVAEVLYRASGRCESCHAPAPFNKKKDGTPYLEVHHKRPLSEGGYDEVDNAMALCPNCHREAHYGMNWKDFRE